MGVLTEPDLFPAVAVQEEAPGTRGVITTWISPWGSAVIPFSEESDANQLPPHPYPSR
jgi:hypothetical protein